MSNARKENVIRIDTSAAFASEQMTIHSIKYIAGTTGTSASIKSDGSSSGMIMWETASTSDVLDHDLNINARQGIYVTVSNSAVVYLYLRNK